MAKVLFVGQSTKHFSYYESSIRQLRKNGHEIVFRYDKIFSNNIIHPALKIYLSETNEEFEWMSRPCSIYRYLLYFIRELRTYSWYLRREDQSLYYVERWADLFPVISKLLKTRVFKKIISNTHIEIFLKKIEFILPPSGIILKDIKNISAQLVYVSPGNMRYSNEIEYLKAAKSLKTITVISVFSWDNLTNKGIFHCKPDYFLVWNRHHSDELVSLHEVPVNNIKVVGAQLFDKWLSKEKDINPDKEIKDMVGKKFILYLGSSSNIAIDETSIIKKFKSQIPQHENIKIIFKPHPANYKIYKNINIDGVVLLDEKYGLTESNKDVSNFECLVRNAKFVIGINTSGFFDAVIIGKKTYALISDAHSETQSLSAHFKLLSSYGVIQEIRSYDDILSSKFDDEFNMKRKEFIVKFVRPNGIDVASGQTAAKYIQDLLK
jgi:hypothetical protein